MVVCGTKRVDLFSSRYIIMSGEVLQKIWRLYLTAEFDVVSIWQQIFLSSHESLVRTIFWLAVAVS